jgi:hypothetical protein
VAGEESDGRVSFLEREAGESTLSALYESFGTSRARGSRCIALYPDYGQTGLQVSRDPPDEYKSRISGPFQAVGYASRFSVTTGPFAGAVSLSRLPRLAVWFIELGIVPV